ncbi:NAD(P)-binding protein [Teratosphaeria nubilosa]|uniref:NAD(P)-binding protein n=1 Tax=Teratosphaeria nubilosa TaxID=161662 RepID=A0A6G1L1D6_9PEZI|nr:NAD(P)-binding protein [Teratosphaeria nubilosa]
MSVENKIESLFNVKGLVAVVTGGGSGLGSYAAKALDANGAKAVYIVGRREDALQTVAKAAVNGTIKPIVGDVTDKSSLSKITDRIRQEQGYVNFLFANAGVMGPSDRQALDAISKPSVKDIQEALWKPEPDAYTKALHINVTGAYYTAIAFLDLLDAANKKRNVPQDSSILITSSIAGYSRHLASSFAYSTSKAAVNHLVKTLSTLFAQQQMHIRVNGVNPGLYPSEMTAGSTSKLDKFGGIDGHQGAFADAHTMPSSVCPAGRTGSEQDLAGLVLFFASHAGAYLNGETLVSDGGRLAQLPASY